MPGQPALVNNASTGITGDVLFHAAAACVGYVVIEYHKVTNSLGAGWTT